MSERDIDAARRIAVDSAADFLEGIAKLKDVGERLFPRPAETQRRRDGDLLFDLMRLNTDYLTRLGELSRQHRDFTTRSLEHLYHGLTSALPEARVDELRFGGEYGWQRTFLLENTIDVQGAEALIDCGPFQGPRPSAPILVRPVVRADGAKVPKSGHLQVPYRSPIRIEISLPAQAFQRRRSYRADLSLRLAGRVRRIRLTVEDDH